MTTRLLYRIERLCVIDVGGQDASTILHNLTTNEVKSLQVGEGRETFITNVKGKALAHGCLYREQGHFRLIGPTGPSEAVSEHIDRYTIREDAAATIVDQDWVGFVLPPGSDWISEINGLQDLAGSTQPDEPLPCGQWSWGEFGGTAYQARWLGEGTQVLLVERANADAMAAAVDGAGGQVVDENRFHAARTVAGYPWYGIDLSESNLPQEADRDAETISFTKGCYLGQETVARLDALGQVQKKLVRWQADDASPPAGTELKAGDKVVGRLTSVAPSQGGFVALAMTRRTHFDTGSTAEGLIQETNQSFTATVL